MSKAQFIILAGFIGFNAFMAIGLFLRACAGLFHLSEAPALPKMKELQRAAGILAQNRLAWTRAIWREQIAEPVREKSAALAATMPQAQTKVLC